MNIWLDRLLSFAKQYNASAAPVSPLGKASNVEYLTTRTDVNPLALKSRIQQAFNRRPAGPQRTPGPPGARPGPHNTANRTETTGDRAAGPSGHSGLPGPPAPSGITETLRNSCCAWFVYVGVFQESDGRGYQTSPVYASLAPFYATVDTI